MFRSAYSWRIFYFEMEQALPLPDVKRRYLLRYVIYGEISFFLSLFIVVVLRPAGLTANSGISYYSTIPVTIAPYLLGLAASSYFLWRSADFLPTDPVHRTVGRALRCCAIFLVGLALSPDIPHNLISGVHMVFGGLLFLTELALSIWLVLKLAPRRRDWLFVITQVGVGIVCLLSLINILPWQIEGQIIFQLAFGTLLIRTFSHQTQPNSSL
jgi:hypothetical protein